MITFAKPIAKAAKVTPQTDAEADAKYVELAPGIRNYVRKRFEECRDPNSLDELVQSVQVYSWESIRSLARKGRLCDAYATVLANYGIRKYLTGRVGGIPSNSTDVLGERCKYLNRAKVKNYGLCEHVTDSFESEATANDGRYPVHRTVGLKIDFFENWLTKQTPRDQRIIKDMAMGETTNDLARKYGVSAASISQYRRKYAESWYAFIDPKEETDFVEELKELAKEAA